MNRIVSRAFAATSLVLAFTWAAAANAQAGKSATGAAASAKKPAPTAQIAPPKDQGKAAAATATGAANTAASNASATAIVDINKATADELKKVPGIGDAYAAKIIAGRPYANKGQLVTKHVMPQGVYDKVKAHLIAKQ